MNIVMILLISCILQVLEYADRVTYLGDPDFFEVPSNILISDQYNNRMASFTFEKSTPSNLISYGKFDFNESEETTHYSIVDKFGNAVSVTTTLNGNYGSGMMIPGTGMLINNEMDDFSTTNLFPRSTSRVIV